MHTWTGRAFLGLHPGVTSFTYTQDSPHYSICYGDVVHNLMRSPLCEHCGEITLNHNLLRVTSMPVFSCHSALLPEHGFFLGTTTQKLQGKTGGPHSSCMGSHFRTRGPTLSKISPTFLSPTNFPPSIFLWVPLYYMCI